MGTPIGDLLYKEEISLVDLRNKTLGIDAYNIIYQFITTIRDINGEYLTNSKGKVTSHIIGLFYRLTKLLEAEINPVFCFDGKPLDLKKETLKKRKDIKIEAEEIVNRKKEKGDLEYISKYMKRTAKIDDEMISDTKELLNAFNIQSFEALHDGEAQLSVMNIEGKIDGVISQDYDVLLLGGKNLYRNVGISGKKKAPRKDYYIKVKPEHINLQKNLEKLNITREKLIWIGMLIGTDFNEKIPKVGPKTAIKLVTKYNSLEDIYDSLNYKPDFDYKKVFNIFWKPKTKNIEIKKAKLPDFEKIKDLLINKYEFNEERVSNTINKLEKILTEKRSQRTLWSNYR